MLQNRKSDPARLVKQINGWLDRPLVLVGLMGVGKSTVGRRLASDLGIAFVDADEEMEAAAQMSIAELFERFGEPYFRDGERRVISRLVVGVPRIIATGGGAFMNDETRALILAGAIAIWLDADLSTLVARVSRRDTRPLLRNADPAAVLARLAEVRNPIYAQAQVHVRSKDGPHHKTVYMILEALCQWHG